MASPETKTIRQIMDPEGTLPDVTLRLDESMLQPRGSGPRTYDIMHGDEVVGGATLVEMRNSRSREAYFNGVNVDEKLRGRDLGLRRTWRLLSMRMHRVKHFEHTTGAKQKQPQRYGVGSLMRASQKLSAHLRPLASTAGQCFMTVTLKYHQCYMLRPGAGTKVWGSAVGLPKSAW